MEHPSRVTRIAVVGSTDRKLEEMLRPIGPHVSSVPLEGLEALVQQATSRPDVIVVDLRERSSAPAALATLKRRHSQTGVVIVASRLDPDLMLEAMRAGVAEWLAEPLTEAAAIAAVRRVAATHGVESNQGQVFAFVGAKGGVGTTTVAVNVAVALARLTQRRSLLVDLHLTHGDAALFLGAEPRFSIIDAFENIRRLDESLLQSLVAHTKLGADLLASSDRTGVAAPEGGHIRSLIETLSEHYSYVSLDVPRSDMTMLDSLELASKIIVVTNQELATVHHTSRLVMPLRQRYGAERVEVVVSRYDKRAEISQQDVERASGMAIRHLIPNAYHLALDAMNRGRPVVVENESRLSSSLKAFTSSLAGLGSDGPPRPRTSRLFGRLTSLLG